MSAPTLKPDPGLERATEAIRGVLTRSGWTADHIDGAAAVLASVTYGRHGFLHDRAILDLLEFHEAHGLPVLLRWQDGRQRVRMIDAPAAIDTQEARGRCLRDVSFLAGQWPAAAYGLREEADE